MSKLNFELKQKIIEFAGTCFWYWGNLYDFFESCGIEKNYYLKYEGESKYKMMRNVLSDLEAKGDDETLKNILSSIYNLKALPDKNVPDEERAKKILRELKDICGEDVIAEEVKKRQAEEKAKASRERVNSVRNASNRIEELNKSFLALFSASDHQQRGYELERIVSELFLINEFEYHKPYKTQNEQVDGYFSFDKFFYLIEVKWVTGEIKQGDLAIFDKKIDKKAKSTRGLFIAMNGFDNDAISSITGKEPRIILMDGEDLSLILNGTSKYMTKI